MSFERIRKNLKKYYNWERHLKSANDVFYIGREKLGLAVKEYGKIIEILLRLLYKEINLVIPSKKKTEILNVEKEIGKGRLPVGKFGLGQLIGLFSKSNLFEVVKEISGSEVFDSKQLEKMNSYRIDHTHYDEEAVKGEVDGIRKYITAILLEFQLITKDPDAQIEIKKAKTEKESDRKAKLERIEHLQRLLSRIRLGLSDNRIIEQVYPIESGNGWFSQVETKAEIVGIYLGESETFVVLVRILKAYMPESYYGNEEVQVYQKVISGVREIIENIEPQTKQNLKILLFDETDGSNLEKAAHVCWDNKAGMYFL